MKPLATELNRHGHELKQIWRNERFALYERSRPNHEPHELEFIVIRKNPEHLFPSGTLAPERENFPSDSQWGVYAWSWPINVKTYLLNFLNREALSSNPQIIRDLVRAYLKTN